jgi:hypothetical protein
MQDIQVTPEERPVIVSEGAGKSRPRKRRFRKALLVLTVFGLGWVGGSRSSELIELVRTSTWVQESGIAAQLDRLAGATQGWTGAAEEPSSAAKASTSAAREGETAMRTAGTHEPGATELVARAAKDLNAGIDQVRASSENRARTLDGAVERLQGSVEGIQRDVAARLDQLQGRVDRIERHVAAAGTGAATHSIPGPTMRPPARPSTQPVARTVPAAEVRTPPKPPRVTRSNAEPAATP